MTVDEAIEVFMGGFAFTRSYTHPYEVHRLEHCRVMRDAPRKGGEYRGEEFVAHGVSPRLVDEEARRETRGRFAVCMIQAVGEPGAEIRAEFKSLGYRLLGTEEFFVHSLTDIPDCADPFPIEQVRDLESANRLAKAARTRQILPQHLKDPSPIRQYMALDGEKPVAWVRSIRVGSATWCSNLFVDSPYRRRGIGRALMLRMLKDDRRAGVSASVLLASHAGSMLYPQLGYQLIGQLLLYKPHSR